MTDYHKQVGWPLVEFRTFLKNLQNLRPDKKIDGTDNIDYAHTFALMEELRQDLLKYKKTGSITCKHCNLVKSSHPWFAKNRGCPGWEPKGTKK